MEMEQLWAKTSPFQSAMTHAIVTGVVAQSLLEGYLSEGALQLLCRSLAMDRDGAIHFVCYLASIHDIGKVEPHFQSKDPAMRAKLEAGGKLSIRSDVRHEKTTGSIVRRIWQENAADTEVSEFFADILAAHHQGKSGRGVKTDNEPWRSLRREMEAELRTRFLGGQPLPFPQSIDEIQGPQASVLILGIVILSDWIASGEMFADAEDWIGSADSQEIIRQKAGQFLEISSLAHQKIDWGGRFCETWPNISAMRSLQAETQAVFCEAGEERIAALLIEAPMGEGKTEAGMYAAMQMARQWGKDGFYVALPTAATSNQMVGRMRKLLEMHNCADQVKLLHASAWLMEDSVQTYNAEDDFAQIRRWLQPRRRSLLAPYAVGTVDQAMMAVCNVKYGVLRLLGLSQKVLIIDEIHSYDVYMSRFIHLLLQWCRALEIPVVLLSATLPPEKKRELLSPYTDQPLAPAYPAITVITERGNARLRPIPATAQRKTVSIKIEPILHQPEEIARLAAQQTAEGGCICVLMNTVDQAQAVYQALKDRHTDAELLLFHARFPAKRRSEIEGACIRRFGKEKSQRPRRAILVATQVVEQSLDVDFDGMISAAAPIDLVLQRMGRIHRHSDTQRPPALSQPGMTLLCPAEEGEWETDQVIYPACLLNQALRLLRSHPSIRIPEDMQTLVADGYDPSKAPAEELEGWLEKQISDQVAAASGTPFQIDQPEAGRIYSGIQCADPFDDEEDGSYLSAKTRLSQPSVTLALLDDGLYEAYRAASGSRTLPPKIAKRVMEQTVSVTKRRVYGALPISSDGEYDKRLDVKIVHLENGCAAMPNGQRLTYDEELGVRIGKDDECDKASI